MRIFDKRENGDRIIEKVEDKMDKLGLKKVKKGYRGQKKPKVNNSTKIKNEENE